MEHDRTVMRPAAVRRIALLANFLCLLCFVEGARAEMFECASPEAPTFHRRIEAADANEALRAAQATWDLKYLEKPDTCLSSADYQTVYRGAFEAERAAPKPATNQATEPAGADCPGKPAAADGYALATWLVLVAPRGCHQTMGALEQLYVAGAAGKFAERCGINVTGQRTATFLTLESVGAASGLQEQIMGTMDRSTTSIKTGMVPFLAGQLFASRGEDRNVCASDMPQRWLQGVTRYLADTEQDPFAGFVETCVNTYRDTQPSAKCSCAAQVLRVTTPDIYRQRFTIGLLREGYNVNGLGTLLLACLLPSVAPPEPQSVSDRSKRQVFCNRLIGRWPGTKTRADQVLVMNRCAADTDLAPQKAAENAAANDKAAARCKGLMNVMDTLRERARTDRFSASMLAQLERNYQQQCR